MPASTTAFALADHLCFALYGASMAVLRAYRPVLDRMDITYPQYLVLAALWERDGRSISEIAEIVGSGEIISPRPGPDRCGNLGDGCALWPG